jgi:peptide/nickel transport system permease protein
MDVVKYAIRKLVGGIPLILGVTFVSFLLMVYFGPDLTFEMLGKNPTPEQIVEVRKELGYDRPFLVRYAQYLQELATLDFGLSDGNLLGVLLALVAAYHRSGWIDKAIMGFSVVGMSISFLIVIIAFQILLSSSYGLNLFPVRGWNVHSLYDYVMYVTVPTLASVFVALGYNTRFYRAVIVEEMTRDHVRTARAFGIRPGKLLYKHILKNSAIPIITRIMFSIPLVIVSGSLLIESYFGIPGVGKVTFDAITTGDQPVLKAVVGLTAVLFVITLLVTDILYRAVDPRVSLK